MASAASQASFEAALAGWPRRLLHVPTMTSYCWSPGNVYGPCEAPPYNAITYTWGRWMLHNPEDHPNVHAVDIKGVEWDIPRIDPERFSREEFMAAILKSTEPAPEDVWRRRLKREPRLDYSPTSVEFLWLDVACIDQRPSSPESAAEIGRQADIFRGAKNVFAWLASFTGDELLETLTNTSIPSPFYPNARLSRPLQTVHEHLEKLCDDPWFSSLWTLQEAFLRQDAAFMSRDGEVPGNKLPLSEEKQYFAVDLAGLVGICRNMVWFINQESWDAPTATTLKISERHQNMIERIGVGGFETYNPLTAFIASGHRQTSREPDRIYGIQQIFGFRLGSSGLGSSGCTFTREELEAQFGREILARYPVMSQLFVSQKPVEFGHGWRISPDSIIENGIFDTNWSNAVSSGHITTMVFHSPASQITYLIIFCTNAYNTYLRQFEDPNFAGEFRQTQRCALTTKTVNNHVWGHFSGKKISFAALLNCTRALTLELRDITDGRGGGNPERIQELDEPLTLLLLSLDVSEFTAGNPTRQPPSGYEGDVPNHMSEDAGCEWLAATYPDDDLIVLGLVFLPIRAFGLILLREPIHSEHGPITCWRRLGWCEWWMTSLLNDQDIRPGAHFEPGIIEGWEAKYGPCLRGLSDDWMDAEGLFG